MTTTARMITPTLSKVHNEAHGHKCQRSNGSGDHCTHLAGVVILVDDQSGHDDNFFARLSGDVDNGPITKTFKIMVVRQTRT